MQISRVFATLLFASICSLSSAQTNPMKLSIDAGDANCVNCPMTAKITLDTDKSLAPNPQVTLQSPGQPPALAQLNGDELRWIEPNLKAHETKTYDVVFSKHATTVPATPEFMFLDGDGCRDLVYGAEPIYRYMHKYDPADRENTYKPYHHIFGFHGEGFITKGPGGPESHHRGIFFGFNTPYGNFWADKVAHQEHLGFTDGTFAGPIAARTTSQIDWIGKDNTPVIHESRSVTAWRPKPGLVILDYDITAESLYGDIKPTGNAHHSGFHFRAAEEVGGSKPSLHSGGCTYLRNEGAKLLKDDEWGNTNWVAGQFSIQGNPYVVVEMSDPTNPHSTFSTRPYGRFGACFTETLKEKQPLHLQYRFVIIDGKDKVDADTLAGMYADYISPAKVETSK